MTETMRFPGNIVTLDDTRSQHGGAGVPEKCFYCAGKAGGQHDADCVCLDRPVKIRVALELVVTVPRSWDKESIEFKFNDGTWCSNNFTGWLDRYMEHGCLCPYTTVEYLGDATLEEAADHYLEPREHPLNAAGQNGQVN